MSTNKQNVPAPAPAPVPKQADEVKTPEVETKDEVKTKAVEKKEKVKRPPFYICDGKAVTSRKGTLEPGDEIKPEWVGGKDRIEELIEAGIVAKG